jgi:hypothetical protein
MSYNQQQPKKLLIPEVVNAVFLLKLIAFLQNQEVEKPSIAAFQQQQNWP